MIILGIDTTTKFCEISLSLGDGSFDVLTLDEGLTHSEKLIVVIHELLSKNKLSINDLKGIAVNIGPGSFTGIRIGVSTVRALAQALKIKVVPINGLDALAYYTSSQHKHDVYIYPIIKAVRNKVYTALYKKNNDKLKKEKDYCIETLDLLYNNIKELTKKNKKIIITGSGVQCLDPDIVETGQWSVSSDSRSLGQWPVSYNVTNDTTYLNNTIALLGLQGFKNHLELDYNFVKPFYLKKSEAEEKWQQLQK